MKKLIVILLFGLFYFLYGGIGEVVESFGKASIERIDMLTFEEKEIKPQSGTKIERDDKITTGDNGRVKLLFKDKTKISIGRNSDLTIDEYLLKDKESVANFNMAKGAFKVVTGKIGKIAPERFKFKTTNAVVGIRGTVFAGNDQKIMCIEKSIFLETKRGIIELSQGQVMDFSTGEVTHFTPAEEKEITQEAGWFATMQEGYNQSVYGSKIGEAGAKDGDEDTGGGHSH